MKTNSIHFLHIVIALFLFSFIDIQTVNAQTDGDFRSGSNGDWLKDDIWEIYNAGSWGPTNADPSDTDNVTIISGHRVTVDKNNSDCNDLVVEAGAVLVVSDPQGTMQINGNLTINGIITSGSKKPFDLTGGGTTFIDGNGFVDNVEFIIHDDVTIESTADLNFVNDITLLASTTVTNNGTISCDNLIGTNASTSVWTNEANSTLSVGSDLFDAATPGLLNAFATGNTVKYSNNVAFVNNPSSSTYYNLTIEGDIKTLIADAIILGDVTISGQFDVSASNFSLSVGGNWVEESIFIERSGTVTFNGNADQTISSLSAERFYDLTVNKTGGMILLSGNLEISNTLTMTSGNINTGSDKKITLGISTATVGTLAHTSGTVIGTYEKWFAAGATGSVLFPIGTSTNYRPIIVSPSSVTTGGTVISEFIESSPGSIATTPLFDDPVNLYNTFSEGYWSLSLDNGFAAGGSYDLSLDGDGFSSFTIDNLTTRIITRTNDVSAWSVDGTHNTVSGNIVSRNTVTTFPVQFAFADNTNCTAPVTSALTGNTIVCTTDANESYSVTDNDGSEYFWTVIGGTMISSSSTSSMTVNWGSTGQVGSVSVYEVNSCTQSFPVTTSINIHSIAPSSISGKENVAEYSNGIIYSVTNQTDYSYTWTITGGSQVSGTTTNSITVDWDGVGVGNVSVVAKYTSCPDASAFDLPIVIYDVINSTGNTDRWDLSTTWDCDCVPTTGESVRILNTHTVNTSNSADISIVHFIVDPGGTLTYNPSSASAFTITGDLTVNGDIGVASANDTLKLINSGKNIDGVGTITSTNPVILKNNTTILSASNLIVAGDLNLQAPTGSSVTNNGIIEIEGSLVELTNQTNWVNAAGSTLKIGNSLSMAGSLYADETDNTVEYNGTVNQDIKIPATSYYNLSFSGTNTKTALADLNINGNLLIDGTSQLDMTTTPFNIILAGNWTNTSTNADPFLEQTGTVTFDGVVTQTVLSTNTETFYGFVTSNSAGISLSSPVDISNNLSLTTGNINTTTTSILSLTNAATYSGGSSTSFVDGPLIKNISSAGSFTFPVGNSGRFGKIILTNTVTAGDWQAEYFNTNPLGETYDPASLNAPLLNVNESEYWEILGPASGTAQITLRWDATSAVSTDATERTTGLKVAQWTATAWSELVTTVTDGSVSSGTLLTDNQIALSTIQVFTIGSTIHFTNSWDGSTDTDWATTSNWSLNKVPSSSIDDVIIPSAPSNQPIITSSAVVGALTINSGANLTVNGTYSLTVNNAFSNEGTLDLKTPGDSNPTGSFITNGTVGGAGTTNIELFTSASRWYYFTSPINSDIASSFLGTGAINFNYFNETFNLDPDPLNGDASNWLTTDLVKSWTKASSIKADSSYITQYDKDTTLIFSGTVRTTDISLPVTFTANDGNGDVFDGWNLVGNSYTSAIDWDNVSIDKNDIEGTIYFWDNVAQNYKYYNTASGGVNGGTQYIPAMQGFFVKSTSISGTLTIPRTARVHNAQAIYKSAGQTPADFMKLRITANNFTDESILRFHDNATDGYDSHYDAYKRFTSNDAVPQVFFKLNSETELAINTLKLRGIDVSVPMGIKVQAGTAYVLEITEFDYPDYHVYLEDLQTSQMIILQANQQYTFDFDGGENTSRFLIHFVNNRAPELINTIPDQEVNEGLAYSYTIPENIFSDIDLGDELLLSAKLSDGNNLPNWLIFNNTSNQFSGTTENSGDFIIEVTASDKFGASISDIFTLSVKSTTSINNMSDSKILMYPNPTQGVFFIQSGTYSDDMIINVRDFSGRIIKTMKTQASKTEVDISEFASGMYFIELTDKVESKVLKINLNK